MIANNDESELSTDANDNKEVETEKYYGDVDSDDKRTPRKRKRKSSHTFAILMKCRAARLMYKFSHNSDSDSKSSDHQKSNRRRKFIRNMKLPNRQNTETNWPALPRPKCTLNQAVARIDLASRRGKQPLPGNKKNLTVKKQNIKPKNQNKKVAAKTNDSMVTTIYVPDIPSDVEWLNLNSDDLASQEMSTESDISEPNFHGFSPEEIAAHPSFSDVYTHIRQMIAEYCEENPPAERAEVIKESAEEARRARSLRITRRAREEPALNALTLAELAAIDADVVNKDYWDECLEVLISQGKKAFYGRILLTFKCSICQYNNRCGLVTTPCNHIFCKHCLVKTFVSNLKVCPTCQYSLTNYAPKINVFVSKAMRTIVPYPMFHYFNH